MKAVKDHLCREGLRGDWDSILLIMESVSEFIDGKVN